MCIRDRIRQAASGCHVELVEVSTQGDQDRTSTLASMGGQGVFTREVQAAVLDGRADIAVHSLKDLPTVPIDGLTLAAVPKRESAIDALVAPLGSIPIGDVAQPEEVARAVLFLATERHVTGTILSLDGGYTAT